MMYLLITQQELFGERQVVGIYSTEKRLHKAIAVWKKQHDLKHDTSSIYHVFISVDAPPAIPELYNEPLHPPEEW